MRRMRRRPLKPLGTLLLMIFTLILAVLVYNSHLGAEEPATEPVAPANTLESANTSEPAEAPANPSAAQPDVNSFWQRQDNELYYYGQGKGNSDERFVFDRRGRLEAAYRDEHLIARYSYPSAYMVVQDIYQNEQKIEQRIYQKDSKGALIATLILKIDDEPASATPDASDKQLDKPAAKPLNERYYGKAKDYILLADTLLALEADTFSRWEDGKLIASSESRLKPASAADLAAGDQSSAQSTTQGDIEEKISRNEQGLNNIESYDPEGRLRRKLTMRDGHIAQEELWIYQGKLLMEHKTQKPNELISERYIYDDADRLLRVEYIQNGRLQKIKEF